MNTQGPSSQANQIAAALQHTGDVSLPPSVLRGNASEAMASSGGEGEERDAQTPRSSHPARGCADTLHELANSMTAVLINAQALEWKLPPYSRLKRPVREIERNARRSEALLKRLLREFEIDLPEAAGQAFCGPVPSWRGTVAAVTAQGPTVTEGPVNLPPPAPSPSAPASALSPETELTSVCDLCTSAVFPKEERWS
jgi:hypothetical protein